MADVLLKQDISWMDAYLAALAIASGAQIVTTDQAFTQFSGVDVLVLKA